MLKIVLTSLILLSLSSPLVAAEVGGVYVLCPKKDLAACPGMAQSFKNVFPMDQPGPYLMIRQGGGGYLAPNDKIGIDLTWQSSGPGSLLIKLDDIKNSKMELLIEGQQLRDKASGDLYQLSLTEADLNPEPVPFKQRHRELEKQRKEQERLQKKMEREQKAKEGQ